MQKILCVGDGFGKGHVWPMWPQLLPEIVNDSEIVNLSEVGAGNEYISQCVIDSCERENYDLVIVQWAKSNRLDLINNKLTSPNYPYEYDPRIVCKWHITTDKGNYISLDFEHIEVSHKR